LVLGVYLHEEYKWISGPKWTLGARRGDARCEPTSSDIRPLEIRSSETRVHARCERGASALPVCRCQRQIGDDEFTMNSCLPAADLQVNIQLWTVYQCVHKKPRNLEFLQHRGALCATGASEADGGSPWWLVTPRGPNGWQTVRLN